MPSFNKNIRSFCLIACTIVLLVGCSGQGEPEAAQEPTVDPNLIFTQAVETVSAQLTTTAMAMPVASPTTPPVVAPTEAPQEMVWPTPTTGAAADTAGTQNSALPANTQAAALPAANQQVVPAVPTVAPTQADKLLDQAMLINQSPGYGWKMSPGGSFDIVWTFENTADEPWNELYTVRRYGGETFGLESSKYTFYENATNVTVNKGEATTITVHGAKAPVGEGVYRSQWRLCNNRDDEGKTYQCFYLMEIEIVVSN